MRSQPCLEALPQCVCPAVRTEADLLGEMRELADQNQVRLLCGSCHLDSALHHSEWI